MNKILLINRINTNSLNPADKRIFFLVGDMQTKKTEIYLMDILNGVNFLKPEDIVYKYNGVEISMKESNIPKLIKLFIDSNIAIYSVYELYDPID